jgi:hypothetical protein
MPADDTITKLLRTAYESVVAADVPEALQGRALEKSIELLAAREGLSHAGQPAPGQGLKAASGNHAPSPTEAQEKSLAKIAAVIGVDAETVDEVFHLEGDVLSLSVGTSKLAAANMVAVKEIALLIAGGRQIGGWDAEWTETALIRPVAEAYGKLDGNFARGLKEMDDQFSFSGSGAGRKLKLKRKGREDFAALVKRLAGEK